MELEDRVKTLEYEMKILKNEVQRTLLEIQEQVLIHYYPSLRAEVSKPPENIVQSIDVLRTKQTFQGTASNKPAVRKVSLDDLRSSDHEDIPPASLPEPGPVVEIVRTKPTHPEVVSSVHLSRKVSLDDLRASSDEKIMAGNSPDQNKVTMLEWVMDSSIAIGGDATSKIIEGFVQRSVLAPVSKDRIDKIALMNRGISIQDVELSELLEQVMKLEVLLGRSGQVEEAHAIAAEVGLG